MHVSILYASPNALMREGFQKIAQAGGGISKLCFCEDAENLFKTLDTDYFDLLILDVDQLDPGGTNLLHKLRNGYKASKILVISSWHQHDRVLKILEGKVDGFLTYECKEDEIIHAIFSICKGEMFYCNKILDIMLEKASPKEEDPDCTPTILTQRESEIVSLIAHGKTSKEIASHLFVSVHTILTHRKNILKKLKINSAAELTKYAINSGLIHSF